MSKVKCHCLVTVPGTYCDIHDHPLIRVLKQELKGCDIESQIVDACMGWGCLDQDWLEFNCEVDTSYGWPRFIPFDSELNEHYQKLFHYGKLLLMLSYIVEKEDGTKKYIPHC